MKHMILNKFLRNDKNTEAPCNWPDNIIQIEQEALEFKKICQDITKRLLLCPIFSGCYHNNSIVGSTGNVWNQNWAKLPNDSDKFSKKLPEQNLAQSLHYSAERLSLLNPHVSKILSVLGDTNNKLALERLQWAANVESGVLEKLRICYEELVPLLVKNRRHLWKQNSDLKALQDRLKSLESSSNILVPNSPVLSHNTHLQSNQSSCQSPIFSEPPISTSVLNSSLNCVSNSNTQNGQWSSYENSKLNQLKATRDELESQIDHLKDMCLREHYRFENSVIDISNAFLNLLKNEANYHQQCLRLIGQVLPDLESSIANNPIPVFGRELSQHLITSRRHIAYTLEICIKHLDNPVTLCEEGLFRIAGGKNKVDTLSSAFNVFRVEKIIKHYDHFVIADCLKQYLRSLPELLLTHHLFDDWMRAVNNDNEDSRLAAMKVCLTKLPTAYFNNLSYLIGFLAKLSSHSDKNKMTPANLGIVFGPNLLSADSSSSGIYSQSVNSTSNVRRKLRSVSNANQMMKKHSYSVTDNSRSCKSEEFNVLLSKNESMRNRKRNNNQYEEDYMSKSVIASNNHCLVIEILISNFNYFFPQQSTHFSQNSIPPKVFPKNYRTKRQNSFNEFTKTDCPYSRHKPNLPSSSSKSVPSTECTDELFVNMPKSNIQYPRRISVDSTDTAGASNSVTKSLATTPTEIGNGTVFPSCIYLRRVSDGTLSNIKPLKDDHFIGSLDLPEMDLSCIDDCQSSSAKSSNECDDLMDTRSILTGARDTDSSEPQKSTQSAKYAPKSFHADVYDTLFALQSLNSYAASTDDYLNRVRSVYEKRTLAKPPGKTQKPLIRQQTINSQTFLVHHGMFYDKWKDSMSKSVTSESILKCSHIPPAKSQATMPIIRRPKPNLNIKLKNYRESSPATIQKLSNDSIDKFGTTVDDFNTMKCKNKPENKLSIEIEDRGIANINSQMRYSMPILLTENGKLSTFLMDALSEDKKMLLLLHYEKLLVKMENVEPEYGTVDELSSNN